MKKPLATDVAGGFFFEMSANLMARSADGADLHVSELNDHLSMPQKNWDNDFFFIPDMAVEDIFQCLATLMQAYQLVACDHGIV
ncbi:hypothetical protein AT574_16050 [Phaeobacter inhibens]|nr:hypothetical protein PhaeoP59_03041 [Phaeobacter inhibens]KXF89612.1 hypothetical protein AT574_16050 [Phaeobacter inhibens]